MIEMTIIAIILTDILMLFRLNVNINIFKFNNYLTEDFNTNNNKEGRYFIYFGVF